MSFNIPMIRWIGEYKGVMVPVLDEYYSRRDRCWYVFGVYDLRVVMLNRDELVRVVTDPTSIQEVNHENVIDSDDHSDSNGSDDDGVERYHPLYG